jgi:cytoskeletal protein CcmA (bactofilin family)
MGGWVMEDHNRVDLNIYGQGNASGGKYNAVSLMGEGKIDGDVDCVNIKVYGEGQLIGNLKTAKTVNIKGQTSIKGNLEANKIKLQGELDVDGAVLVDEAMLTGTINTRGDFNAEIFKLEGGFKINGLLNADILKINLYWPCKVREIGGSQITIKKDGKLSFLGLKNMITHGGHNIVEADIIEGDDIYLENTHSKVVRGNNITLGPGCNIELVEYKNNFKQDKTAEVGTKKTI